MRPIDADQFKENILSGLYIYCQENKEDIANAIDSEPTITTSLNLDNITEEDIKKFKMIWQRANSKGLLTITEDIPHGKWICDNKYLDCRCSICNSCALERGEYPELSPYCPQCGARMEVITNGKEETT